MDLLARRAQTIGIPRRRPAGQPGLRALCLQLMERADLDQVALVAAEVAR